MKNLFKTVAFTFLAIPCLVLFSGCNSESGNTEHSSENLVDGDLLGGADSNYLSSSTSYNMYLYVDGIEGESSDNSHENWINVIDFSHGSAQEVQEGLPDAAGKSYFEPFVFTHYVDKATPKFQEHCMKGARISNATLDIARIIGGVQTTIYKVKFEGIKVVEAVVKSENGKVIEEVSWLCIKQTWTATTITIDNLNGANTEAKYDQSMKN